MMRRGQLPWPKAKERHACEHDRSRLPTLPQGGRAGGEALLHGPRHDGDRHGLAVAGVVTLATGTAERRASETMLKAKVKKLGRRITVGEDKAYDTADHVTNLRAI